MSLNRTVFVVMVLLTPLLALWCHGFYHATSAGYSDLAHFGINYGSEPFTEIVRITQKDILWIAIPPGIAYVMAMCGWALALHSQSRENYRDAQRAPSGADDSEAG